MQIKQEELEYKIKHPHNLSSSPYTKLKEEMIKKKKSQNSPDKIILPDIPDIGRYNPNYDSVRIHPFYPTFARIDFTNFNKYKNNAIKHQISEVKKNNNDSFINISEPNIKSKNKSSLLKTEHFMTDPSHYKKNKSKISKRNLNNSNSNNNISQFISTSTVGEEKNNKSIKFDSYSGERPMVNKKLYDSEMKNSITNYNPIRCIKGNVDFNKISSNSHLRSFFDEIIKNNNNPPLGMYRPNYDYIATIYHSELLGIDAGTEYTYYIYKSDETTKRKKRISTRRPDYPRACLGPAGGQTARGDPEPRLPGE